MRYPDVDWARKRADELRQWVAKVRPDIGHARRRADELTEWAATARPLVLASVADSDLDEELAAAYDSAVRWRECEIRRQYRLAAVVDFVSVLIVVAVLVASGFWVHQQVGPELNAPLILGGFVSGFGGLVLLDKLPTRRFWLFWDSLITACLLGAAYLLWREVGSLGEIASSSWRTALSAALAVPLLFILVSPLSLVTTWSLNRYAILSEPKEAVLCKLFFLALALEDSRALESRGILLRLVANAADAVETGLWREVDLSNPLSRNTLRARCKQCAQHLRSYDLWIALPRRDTRELLRAEIVGLIHVLVRGHLDELPTTAPSPRRRLAVIGNAVRSLLLGLIPLAAVLAAKLLGLDLSGPIGGTLVVIAIAWFVLTVITTFDGQAATRISFLRDAGEAMAAFRGGKP
ncbi:hypothetical protein ACIA8G_36925 [Lentzea sp. NPDC051213]|uniref:hypothetical protein n=1 Tax=Lentzea sp. NPDC051213 TaxID=3364126 RepID=UPI003788EA27